MDLLYDVDGRGVATLTLNRPDRHNAFDDALITVLTEALEGLAVARRDARAGVQERLPGRGALSPQGAFRGRPDAGSVDERGGEHLRSVYPTPTGSGAAAGHGRRWLQSADSSRRRRRR